jgi:thioredoxin reductase (NADPH)
MHNVEEIYDVIIIGGGPAGLSAAVYASRSKLKTALIEEKRKLGGQPSTYEDMENYPGVLGKTAPELMNDFEKHALKFGTEIIKGEVIDIEVKGFHKSVTTKDGNKITGKTIIITSGAEPRKLGIAGEEEFKGKGVSYCATCDADFFEELEVAVVGNGNSAIEESIYLTKFADKVTIIVIHDEGTMDAEKILQEKAYQNEKIEFIWNSTLVEAKGDGLVETAVLKNIKTGNITEFNCDGIFVFIGRVPKIDFLKGKIELNKQGYIKTNERLETNLPGVYAAGDVIEKYLRQVITAASDGAIAAMAAGGYIEVEEYWEENVLKEEKDVLVAFWNPINQASINVLQNLETANLDTEKVKLVKMDIYKNTIISERYSVTEIPTVLKFRKGEVIERYDPAIFDKQNSICNQMV